MLPTTAAESGRFGLERRKARRPGRSTALDNHERGHRLGAHGAPPARSRRPRHPDVEPGRTLAGVQDDDVERGTSQTASRRSGLTWTSTSAPAFSAAERARAASRSSAHDDRGVTARARPSRRSPRRATGRRCPIAGRVRPFARRSSRRANGSSVDLPRGKTCEFLMI